MPNFPRRRAKGSAAQVKVPKTSRFSRFARRARGEDLDRPRHRGIYLLPNAFTTAALFCGFYAIVMAMNQKFEHAPGRSSSPWCWTAWTAASPA